MKAQVARCDFPEQLREIAGMDRGQCRRAWSDAFNADPPNYMSIPFMRRVLAHDLQCRSFGGDSAATRRALKLVLGGKDAFDVAHVACEGSTLMREWNGRVYRVEASGNGYVLDGKASDTAAFAASLEASAFFRISLAVATSSSASCCGGVSPSKLLLDTSPKLSNQSSAEAVAVASKLFKFEETFSDKLSVPPLNCCHRCKAQHN